MTKNGKKAPDPDSNTLLRLWAKAGGRCSFPGCPEYLLHDSLTGNEIKHGYAAHIVGRSRNPRSPRGQHPLPLEERSKVSNLILLCIKHHLLIDNKRTRDDYSVEILHEYKRQHEERIYHLVNLVPAHKTVVLCVKSIINGEIVSESVGEFTKALLKRGRYPSQDSIVIDLTQHPDGESAAYIQFGKEQIDAKVSELYSKGLFRSDVQHISVFALAPIPLLIHLGYRLSNKVHTDLYQRHRDSQDWCWKEETGKAIHKWQLIQEGADPSRVAVILSLSGSISLSQLPSNIDGSFFIYEITLDSQNPNPMYLRTLADLEDFQDIYYQLLAEISFRHPHLDSIHLFPAIPAPVAVMIGRELLKKISASLIVYDNKKKRGGFVEVLEVGRNE